MRRQRGSATTPCGRERGAALVMLTLLVTVFVGTTAILVDLAQLRVSSRYEQLYVDMAATAAGAELTAGNPVGACQDAVRSINTNGKRLTSPIDPLAFCSALASACDEATPESKPLVTKGDVTVSIHYPVPASEIQSAYWTGAGTNDGTTQCERMRVLVTTKDRGGFSRVLGFRSNETTRTATVRPYPTAGSPPALWVLDPTGCVALKVDGGAQVTVGTSTTPGVITVDSNGSTCSGSSTTVSSTGAGTKLQAIGPPNGGVTGRMNLGALPAGAGACSFPACDPNDVVNGRLLPQPNHGTNATRQYVDWRYNCKSSYPTFHGQTINGCKNAASTGGTGYAYIDLLKNAVGSSGTPAQGSWTTIGPGAGQCSPAASVVYPVGNYYVRCAKSNNGFTVNGGVTITFAGGNVVFDDNITVSNGGTLRLNTANTTTSLPSSCVPPNVGTPCIGSSSSNAAFVYIRGDSSTSFSTSGTGTVIANHVFVYGGTGSVAFSGNPPTWTAPTEGPFNGLAYWSDMPASASNAQLSSFVITGGGGGTLSGVFFAPEAAPFKIAGGGNWGQQHAQFISYQLMVTGGGIVAMSPDPTAVVPLEPRGYLIR